MEDIENNIEYKIDTQQGLSTIYTIPISKKDVPNNIVEITLKKGTSYTGTTFYNVYRGRKMVKQFYGDGTEKQAYAFVNTLKEYHSN